MTKADIAERIQTVTGLSRKESAEMVHEVLSIMKSTLESGEDLKISGFGSFVVKQKLDRRGRNPHTGEALIVSGRRIVKFKPSAVLRNTLNKTGAADAEEYLSGLSPSLGQVGVFE